MFVSAMVFSGSVPTGAILGCVCVCVCVSHSVMSNSL